MTVLFTDRSGAPLNDVPDSRGRDHGASQDPTFAASEGGLAGLSNSTAWDVVAGQSQFASDLQDFVIGMEESPELRSAALLQAMTRLRDALDQIPEDTDLEAPVSLSVRDAVLIARRLLTPLR